MLATLDHPGIVPVHDVGRTTDGLCYVVSKVVAGQDLRARLRQARPFCAEAAGLVAQVAEASMAEGSPVIEKIYAATDCGIVVNPTGADQQVRGGMVDGMGHAMFTNMTFTNGVADQKNFDTYRLIRMKETPEIETHFVDNGIDPTGLGEPALPPTGGAVANALYKATGKRLRNQPFTEQEEFKGFKLGDRA
jgi:isoquinoline 1-oxidoreductase beta subunit